MDFQTSGVKTWNQMCATSAQEDKSVLLRCCPTREAISGMPSAFTDTGRGGVAIDKVFIEEGQERMGNEKENCQGY